MVMNHKSSRGFTGTTPKGQRPYVKSPNRAKSAEIKPSTLTPEQIAWAVEEAKRMRKGR